ncbi:MAG TPA: hypothetical protein VMT30_00190 [Candidatus Saccharimonadia bacterium]|nr:hypothetical protein [Candidatus Saccharimonadia bacterium]
MPPGSTPPLAPSPQTPLPKPPPPAKNRHAGWHRLTDRANVVGAVVGLFAFLLAVGGVVGFYYARLNQPAKTEPKSNVTALSPAELAKLSEIGNSLGSSGQTLNIGAGALFRGKVDVAGDLSIGGRLNANGPVTLSQLNVTGGGGVIGLNVGSNLNVTGTTVLQQTLSVTGLATFAGGINVGGNASFNAINASSLAVRNLSISGPLVVGHLTTQGPTPGFVTGPAVGSGGTASISGNDTAGTLNFNTGGGPPSGVLGTITFRAAYTATVHVLLTPLTGAGAATPAYVTRTTGGFQVHTDTAPPSGAVLSYDYLVTQ